MLYQKMEILRGCGKGFLPAAVLHDKPNHHGHLLLQAAQISVRGPAVFLALEDIGESDARLWSQLRVLKHHLKHRPPLGAEVVHLVLVRVVEQHHPSLLPRPPQPGAVRAVGGVLGGAEAADAAGAALALVPRQAAWRPVHETLGEFPKKDVTLRILSEISCLEES